MDKQKLLKELDLFSMKTGGLGSWLNQETDTEVFDRLITIESDPLSKVQLNQLLAFGHEAPVSDGFFHYYWLSVPLYHPYDVKTIYEYADQWKDSSAIVSVGHLKWGLYRIFTDALLWFGNVRTAYRKLRSMNHEQLKTYFSSKRINTQLVKERGPALPIKQIAKDDRYLISEMACKSYDEQPDSPSALKQALLQAFNNYTKTGGKQITIRSLLEGDFVKENYEDKQTELIFSADDVLEEVIASEQDIEAKYEEVAIKFLSARKAALKNTRYYLSMVGDLDVYVATSMRTRQDFRKMANTCERIFSDEKLRDLELRYFDPTLSAAAGHEDKGLIECLMVKCAKVLLYCAGERESYGKDAEAAMALSLGKPVIFYCDSESKNRFYKEVHPLSRLIEFETGVAVGAMVTDKLEEVSELLYRIFENKMEYVLEKPKLDYLRLKEKTTKSVVRLQTSDQMLSESFWNFYHNRPSVS